jgi:hypothetical protein
MSNLRPTGCRMAQVIEVIETRAVRGNGESTGDPIREVYQYWSRDGKLLAEHDTLKRLTNDSVQ